MPLTKCQDNDILLIQLKEGDIPMTKCQDNDILLIQRRKVTYPRLNVKILTYS